MSGYYSGRPNFGGISLPTADTGPNVFLAQLATSGAHQFSGGFGGPGAQGIGCTTGQRFGNVLAVDSESNVLLVGSFENSLALSGACATAGAVGGSDAYVAKFNSSGDCLWAKSFGSSGEEAAFSVSVDHDDAVLVAGTCGSDVDFGGGMRTCAEANTLFLLKLAPDGSHLWSNTFGGLNMNPCQVHLAVDGDNSALVAGSFVAGDLDFGGGLLTQHGVGDVYVGKIGADGGYAWQRAFGGEGNDWLHAVAVDSADNVLITGKCAELVYFDDFYCDAFPGEDAYIVKLDSGGTPVSGAAFSFGNDFAQTGTAISVRDDEVLWAGNCYGDLQVDGHDVDCGVGLEGVFVAAVDSVSMAPLHFAVFPATAMPPKLALLASGGLVVGGSFRDEIRFPPLAALDGTDSADQPDNFDIFLARLSTE